MWPFYGMGINEIKTHICKLMELLMMNGSRSTRGESILPFIHEGILY